MSLMRVRPSNNLIDPLDPNPSLIEIGDVAYHLAGINRYGGASRLTVAQHCSEMANYALRNATFANGKPAENYRLPAFECLMHDAAEYLLGDMIRPLKHSSDLGRVYFGIESRVYDIIRGVFGVTNRYADAVDSLDKRMCATEQRDLFGGTSSTLCFPDISIVEWDARAAETQFKRLFYLLRPLSAESVQVAA